MRSHRRNRTTPETVLASYQVTRARRDVRLEPRTEGGSGPGALTPSCRLRRWWNSVVAGEPDQRYAAGPARAVTPCRSSQASR